ncbi:DUF1353 domain-containing protein [Tropicibacter naphthalenivorans]|uniref:DUF1353 domain-containing protein n=1 Tax=Tropicibacter naphthalenivorans TaxID=441103 RepID=A0A0P1GSG5_9RHOB|nr:DUF1353 domain-containing protein [Tropicibacter naphthalenivorans]CUH78101.1 hypothetical protein TRN7648_01793 [Tropicibacter naphthalenivorans]SMC93581.1 Protein of unknown function [Tropicibacter naphthalenivorans]
MKPFSLFVAGMLVLSACDTAQVPQPGAAEPEISCRTQPGCAFDRAPLRVLNEPVTIPRRAYTFFPTAQSLTFVDATGRQWFAPPRTLTDGASIPPMFVEIVGDPTSPEFINAAAMHDAYCGIGNEEGSRFHQALWQDVHRMFYDGLIVGGTNETTAKIMFAAVWLGGPRWAGPGRAARVSTQGPALGARAGYVRTLDHIPVSERQSMMRQTKAYIQRANPTLPQLEGYLNRIEAQTLARFPLVDASEEEAHHDDDYAYDDTAYDDTTAAGGTTDAGGTSTAGGVIDTPVVTDPGDLLLDPSTGCVGDPTGVDC